MPVFQISPRLSTAPIMKMSHAHHRMHASCAPPRVPASRVCTPPHPLPPHVPAFRGLPPLSSRHPTRTPLTCTPAVRCRSRAPCSSGPPCAHLPCAAFKCTPRTCWASRMCEASHVLPVTCSLSLAVLSRNVPHLPCAARGRCRQGSCCVILCVTFVLGGGRFGGGALLGGMAGLLR